MRGAERNLTGLEQQQYAFSNPEHSVADQQSAHSRLYDSTLCSFLLFCEHTSFLKEIVISAGCDEALTAWVELGGSLTGLRLRSRVEWSGGVVLCWISRYPFLPDHSTLPCPTYGAIGMRLWQRTVIVV